MARRLHLGVEEVNMRGTHLFGFIVAGVVVVGCRSQKDATSAPTITSGPLVGEAELPRTLRAASEAIALGVCQHENYCGRPSDTCVDATVKQARAELTRWNCEPAAIRARFEECLVGFEAMPCGINLRTDAQPFCPANVVCGDTNYAMIPTGRALAEIWR